MKVMLDQNTPASTRVRAAEIIVNQAAKAIEIEDIEARVSELERTTGASNQRGVAILWISRNLTRRLEDLESRIEPVWEPRVLNIQFVNTDFEVVRQMPITLYTLAANDAVRDREHDGGVADNAVTTATSIS